jgi:hypothetical protein
MKRLLMVVVSVAVLAAAGASGAFAGEVKGPPGTPGVAGSNAGEPTGAVTNSNSVCSHSGLNDMNLGQGPIDKITQTPGNQGPPGAPGKDGTCAGGSNFTRNK